MAHLKQNLIHSGPLHSELEIIEEETGLRMYSQLHVKKKSFAEEKR